MSVNDDYYLSRGLYFGYWKNLSEEERVEEIKQLILDMLDWAEQSETEHIYIKLYNCFEDNKI